MQAFRNAFKKFPRQLKSRSEALRRQGVESLEGIQPLYDRKPQWWARWTWSLVCADLFMTASACELTWSHWTQLEEVPQDDPNAEKKEEYVLRPIWQRAPFTAGQLFIGVALATLLLGSRSRVIRRLYILPPSPSSSIPNTVASVPSTLSKSLKDKRVVLQSVHHFRGQGRVVPMSSCTLQRGQDDSEVDILVDGLRGKFFLGLKGAEVQGKKLPLWNARETLYTTFYGKEGRLRLAKGGWTSGPVLGP